jgi:hypothetical protein
MHRNRQTTQTPGRGPQKWRSYCTPYYELYFEVLHIELSHDILDWLESVGIRQSEVRIRQAKFGIRTINNIYKVRTWQFLSLVISKMSMTCWSFGQFENVNAWAREVLGHL